jgi:hypothetical protein
MELKALNPPCAMVLKLIKKLLLGEQNTLKYNILLHIVISADFDKNDINYFTPLNISFFVTLKLQPGGNMGITYNPAHSILDIGNTTRGVYDTRILKHTQENDVIVDKLEILKKALTQINSDKARTNKIDYSKNEQVRELLKQVRAIAPEIIGQNDVWSMEETQSYIENIRTHMSSLTSELSLPMMLINQLFSQCNSIEEVVAEIIKMYREETRHFVQNQIAH